MVQIHTVRVTPGFAFCALLANCSNASPRAAPSAQVGTVDCDPSRERECVCAAQLSCPATLEDALRNVTNECPRLYRGLREQRDGVVAVTSAFGLAASTFYYDARGKLIGSKHLNDDLSEESAGVVVHDLERTCSLCPEQSEGIPRCPG